MISFIFKFLLPAILLHFAGTWFFDHVYPMIADVPEHVYHIAGWTWVLWLGWFLLRKFTN